MRASAKEHSSLGTAEEMSQVTEKEERKREGGRELTEETHIKRQTGPTRESDD